MTPTDGGRQHTPGPVLRAVR